MQTKESVQVMQSKDGGQPFELTSSAKKASRVVKGISSNSNKSDDGRQPLKLTSSAKNRPCSLKNQFKL